MTLKTMESHCLARNLELTLDTVKLCVFIS